MPSRATASAPPVVSGVGVVVSDSSSSASSPSVRYIPGLNYLPTSPVRHRQLDDVVHSATSVDSPPRKLSAALSSTGSGAPSPRRKPRRRGANKKQQQQHKGDEQQNTQPQQQRPPRKQKQKDPLPDPLNGTITQYFPASPKHGATNNNNNNNDEDVKVAMNDGGDASPTNNAKDDAPAQPLSGITHLCNGNSTSKQQQQQQQPAPTPGKKKKRRRKKTAAAESSPFTIADSCPHHHGLLSPPVAGKKNNNNNNNNSYNNGCDVDAKRRQSQLTDYYQVRRSDRRPKSEQEKEEKERIIERIKDGSTDGLRVDEIPLKGRGVVADKNFCRGEFVIEYDGDLISVDKAKERETEYRLNPEVGCYMYYFSFQNRKYCVDATSESGKLGRLINHSTKTPNLTTRLFPIGQRPHLIFVAARDIDAGEELMYDYGDRSKEATEAHPWLKY